jgi:hypothetical protein
MANGSAEWMKEGIWGMYNDDCGHHRPHEGWGRVIKQQEGKGKLNE